MDRLCDRRMSKQRFVSRRDFLFNAGGGISGGTVIGSSDQLGAYPASNPQTPENMAATIYHALGIPHEAVWHDEQSRPHAVYYGNPIAGLT